MRPALALSRVALAGLELALLGLALALAQQIAGGALALTPPILAAALLAGALLDALAERMGWLGAARLAIPAAVTALTLALAGVPEQPAQLVPVLGLALLAGWRGSRLGVPTAASEVQRRFTRGLLVLLALVGAAQLPSFDAAARGAATLAAIAYSACGLLALALMRDAAGGRSGWRQPLWLALLTLLPHGLALLLAGALSDDAAALIGQVYGAAVGVIVLLLTPVAALLFAAAEALARLLPEAPAGQPPVLLQTPAPLADPSELPGAAAAAGAPDLAVLGWAGAIIALAALAALLARRGRRSRREQGEAEERDSVWSWGQARDDLAGLAARLGGRPRRALSPDEEALQRLRGDDPRARVRRAYLRIVARAAQRGQARRPAQTPAEYAAALAGAVAPHQSELDDLTRSFERARYRSAAPTTDDAARAEAAAQTLAELPAARGDRLTPPP